MKMQLYFCLILSIWNLIVFILYGLDKRRAILGRYRIPEKTLIVTCLIAGGLGALLGGLIFHHKVRKTYFKIVWIIGIIIDVIIIYFVLVRFL